MLIPDPLFSFQSVFSIIMAGNSAIKKQNHMNKGKPVEVELSPGASRLYVFFGGIAAGIAMPPFEFYNSSKIIAEHKLFIRDFRQCWYHDGLPGISHDIYSTARFIAKEIAKLNPEKVFFAGNSMGGYAAILFASLLKKGEVIAFAPQTFISPFLRFRYRDKRWRKKIFMTYKRSLFKAKQWDLKPLLTQEQWNTKISIFVSIDSRLDNIHALHLKQITGVSIYGFRGGGHGIVRLLRDEGLLPSIMAGTYQG
jgi:pimeloyl-ACP methyl ester carboxylesterase